VVQHKDLDDTLELVVDRNIVVEEEEEDAPDGSVVDMLLKDH
jgi:hypothetical protein